MSFPRMVYRMVVIGVMFGWAGCLTAALPERKTFQFGEFTIEASAGDEEYVEALAVQLVDFKPPVPVASAPLRLSLDNLAGRRDYFLGRIAAMLGLPQPTKKMGETFDEALRGAQNYRGWRIQEAPRRYAVWRRAEVLARFEKGETVTGFGRDQTGELAVDFSFLFNPGPDSAVAPERIRSQMTRAWRELAWPVYIGPRPNQSPASEVAHDLEQLGQVANATGGLYIQVMLSAGVWNVLRHTTASGVAANLSTSADQRWLGDGVANYVALKIVETEVGRNEAKAYYDLAAELTKFSPLVSRIDLTNWPTSEEKGGLDYPVELNAANHAFATKVIADVCAKHGDGILPRFFQEVRKTPNEKASVETVYRAFRKLTREDLRAYLPKPSTKR